jgi:hypothetical protein
MEKQIILCMRIDKVSGTSSIKQDRSDICCKCNRAVVVAASTPAPRGTLCMCLECVDWSEVYNVRAPTKEQWNEVARSMEKKG